MWVCRGRGGGNPDTDEKSKIISHGKSAEGTDGRAVTLPWYKPLSNANCNKNSNSGLVGADCLLKLFFFLIVKAVTVRLQTTTPNTSCSKGSDMGPLLSGCDVN